MGSPALASPLWLPPSHKWASISFREPHHEISFEMRVWQGHDSWAESRGDGRKVEASQGMAREGGGIRISQH